MNNIEKFKNDIGECLQEILWIVQDRIGLEKDLIDLIKAVNKISGGITQDEWNLKTTTAVMVEDVISKLLKKYDASSYDLSDPDNLGND